MAATRTARKTTTAKADGRTHTGRTGPLVPVDPYANTSHSMRRHVGLRFEQITVGQSSLRWSRRLAQAGCCTAPRTANPTAGSAHAPQRLSTTRPHSWW
jgi:hypothetical protein